MERIIFRQGKEVSLALLDQSDIGLLTQWFNDQDMTRYTQQYLPKYIQQETEWLTSLPTKQPNDFVFGIIVNNTKTLIGTAGLHRVSWKDRHGTLGMVIGPPDCREKGYGTEAAYLLCDYAFNTLNLRKLSAHAYELNTRSQALIRKSGGVEEGRLKEHRFIDGKYTDEVIFSIWAKKFREIHS